MWVRLACVIRKDTLAKEGDQVVEIAAILRRKAGDQRLGVVSRKRPLGRLVAKRAKMVDHEIRDAAAHAPHRRVVELEIRAERCVGHGVETYPALARKSDERPMEPLTLSGILVIYQTEDSVPDCHSGRRPPVWSTQLFVSCWSREREPIMALAEQ